MKKSMLFVGAMLLLSQPLFAFDNDRTGKVDIGFAIGGAFVEEAGVDNTIHYNAGIAYGVSPDIALGIEGGWHESDAAPRNSENVGVGIVLVDIIFRGQNWTFHENWVPFFIVGIGYANTYIENQGGTNPSTEGDDVANDSFAYKMGMGLDYFANERWILSLELAYVGIDPDFTAPPIVSINDANYWSLSAGVKYVY